MSLDYTQMDNFHRQYEVELVYQSSLLNGREITEYHVDFDHAMRSVRYAQGSEVGIVKMARIAKRANKETA